MKLLKVTVILLVLFSISISAQKAKLGGGMAYGTEISTVGFYVGGLYQFSNKIEGAGYFTYFLKKDNLQWYAVDLNAHYLFISKKGLDVYALAGVNMTFWNYKVDVEPYNGEYGQFVSMFQEEALESSGTETGLNIGAGVRKNISEKLQLMGELKYTIGGSEYLNIKAGVMYAL